MYKLCWEGKIDVGMEFNLINTADKLLLLLMAAAIMRHFVIIVTSNNTVIRWQRKKMWGHRRQDWKRRPQSKHKTALLIPGACYPHPSHISFLNCSLLLRSIYHSQCQCGSLLVFYGETWPQSLALPWQVPALTRCDSVVARPGWHRRCCVTPSAGWCQENRQGFPCQCSSSALPLSSTQGYHRPRRWLLPFWCLSSLT